MCSKEVRCPHPCYRTFRSKLLLRVSLDVAGEIETKCPKKKRCIVTYNANKGIITEKEYHKIDTILIQKHRPVFGSI